MEFYAMALKKKINIPEEEITYKVANGRKFAIGKYFVGKKEYKASRIMGCCDDGKKSKKKKK